MPSEPLRRFALVACVAVVAAGWAMAWPDAAAQTPSPPLVKTYFPPKGSWAPRDPAAVGMNKAKIDEAIAFATKNENTRTKDLSVDIPNTFRNEAPYNNLIGPTQERAGINGIIIRRGYVVASWGDTDRADMMFSTTKTFLSTVVGLAYDRKLIKNVHDKVGPYMPKGVDLFTSPHNAKITWDHLLRQTSDWSGTLWGKPDWADRPPAGQKPEQWEQREMREPGTFYKYNDTRVNVLSLAALYVWKQPLPDVLREHVMNPIGGSSTWHWEPYTNAYVTIDGKKMPSVPGGGHHGGGMFMSAWDMARFGYLFLRNGQWTGKRLISTEWIDMAKTPGTGTNAESKVYGFMNWFLNVPSPTNGRKMYADAPNSIVAFRGNGENLIYVDWENDLVVVVRWIGGQPNGFFKLVLDSINKS